MYFSTHTHTHTLHPHIRLLPLVVSGLYAAYSVRLTEWRTAGPSRLTDPELPASLLPPPTALLRRSGMRLGARFEEVATDDV